MAEFGTMENDLDDIFLDDSNVAKTGDSECLDFDGTIEDDGGKFILLEEGDYVYTVESIERGRFPGSAKLPACNKVTLTLSIDTPEGAASVKTDLILHRRLEWKLSSFFRSVGMKRHGERLVMDWNGSVGRRGLAHFAPRTYTGTDGQEHQANDCKNFLDRPAQQAAQGAQPPVQPAQASQGITQPARAVQSTQSTQTPVQVQAGDWTPVSLDDELPFA